MQIPKSAPKIIELAEEHGWRVNVVQDPTIDRYGLELVRGSTKLQAVWDGGRAKGGRVVLDAPVYSINLQQLREYIVAEPEWEGRTLNEIIEKDLRALSEEQPDTQRERMHDEFEYLGTFLSGHPLDQIPPLLYPDTVDISTLDEMDINGRYLWHEGEEIQFIGMVEQLEVKRSRRGGTPFALFSLTDQSGSARCFAFGEGYEGMKNGMLIWAKGVVSERNELREFRVKTARELTW